MYIDRSSQTSKREIIQNVKDRAKLQLASKGPGPDDGCCGANYKCWPKVMIFPEGTCVNGRCMTMLKVGTFLPGVAIQPVIIKYPVSDKASKRPRL